MDRPIFNRQLTDLFDVSPIVALLGPRQCGKTTLSTQFAEAARMRGEPVSRFDLEDPTDLAALAQPKLALERLSGWVIIDEIQRVPELFPVLRVLVDRPNNGAPGVRFLVLGSASRDLIQQSSETLAGRISYLELTPFAVPEIGGDIEQLWQRGGFPRSYLAGSEAISLRWRKDYIATFLERDLPALGISIPPASLRRFWMMLAHYHGQVLNFSELGRSFGAADTTIRRYLDILAGTFMIRLLTPWHENVSKRQVKAPKLYLRDSGVLHSLLAIPDQAALRTHPKLGASWEGFAIEEIIRHHRAATEDVYFWATHGGGELDLLVLTERGRIGYEVKFTDSPRMTKAMKSAMETLQLDELHVVHPAQRSFPLAEGVHAVGLETLLLGSPAQ